MDRCDSGIRVGVLLAMSTSSSAQIWLEYIGTSLDSQGEELAAATPQDNIRFCGEVRAAITQCEPFEGRCPVRRADGSYSLVLDSGCGLYAKPRKELVALVRYPSRHRKT